jgi:hypothetical protein
MLCYLSWYELIFYNRDFFLFLLDNYVPGMKNEIPYCLSVDCGDRLPLGDEKSCVLPDDNISCYYKAPEVECTVQGQCNPVY